MSGDIVNLRQFRKKQARVEKEKQADANRIAFGRTKAEKTLTRAINQKAERDHGAGRIEPLPVAGPDGGETRGEDGQE